jgi:hypothetical protein
MSFSATPFRSNDSTPFPSVPWFVLNVATMADFTDAGTATNVFAIRSTCRETHPQ